MRRLNLDQVQTLVAVADLGTLAAAAQALHLSPPAVSLHIQELEARLQTPLLLRGRRQASLTPAGQVLVEDGRRLLADSGLLIERVRQRGQGLSARVRLGTSAGVSAQLLPQLLERLRAQASDVALGLEICSSAHAMERLAHGSLDLALVALPLPAHEQVLVHAWRNDPMLAFLPAHWPAPDAVTPQWLNRQPWICFAPGTQMHRLLSTWFAQAGELPQPCMEMSYPEAMRSLVAAGHAMTVLPLETPLDAVSASLVQRPLLPPLRRPLAIAQRAATAQDPAVKAVLQALQTFADPGPAP